IPRPRVSETGKAARGSVLREASYGWKYLRDRPGLMGLLGLFAIANFALGFFSALFAPLMLSFTSEGVMGSVMSVGGVGMLIGSLLMSAWGGPQRKIHGVMTALFLFGIGLSVTGLRADPWLIGAAIFIEFLLLSICNASSQAIWQAKVAPDLQGRVFATRMMVALIATPLAYLLAGPLADRVFEPIMAPDGALAESLGRLIGVGTGRGIGLIFILMGLLISFATVVAYLNPRIRLVEEELPDHVVGLEGEPGIAVVGKAAGTVGS
ncbi:MAG: MFS transporter, partial [Anaerolineales bacterium]